MLILLTHANHLYTDRKQVAKMQPYPPLQTLIAAALLRARGHQVALFDATFQRDFARALDACRPDLVAVCEDNFNFLTKMCLLANRDLAFAMARAAQARGIPCVVNSSDASGDPAAYLMAGFDRVIVGELEATLAALCASWPKPVPGMAGQPPRPPVADLDALPMPAWDLVDMEAYRHAWRTAHGYFALNLVASRGCPFQCNWCAKPIHGDAYRTQSPGRTAAEIELVRHSFQPDRIWFADDIFGLSGRWTRELAARMEGSRVPFKMQSRCDLMTRATVDALAQAGCEEVWMGAESGSQRVLDAMDKGIRVEQIRVAAANLRRHGIRACLFLQFGYPGEEWEDVLRTVELVRQVQPDDVGVSVSYPLPATRLHQIAGGHSHWRDSGELAVIFPGVFSTEVYRAVADALHLEVRGGGSAPGLRDAWDKVEQLRCAVC